MKSVEGALPHNGTAGAVSQQKQTVKMLYTPEERVRRDATKWTLVQGILAPVQFVVFLISLGLVLRYLGTGDGYAAATVSVVIKTLVLYTIMITGAIWEREVFGCYLFAPAFFWEDGLAPAPADRRAARRVLPDRRARFPAAFGDASSRQASKRTSAATPTRPSLATSGRAGAERA